MAKVAPHYTRERCNDWALLAGTLTPKVTGCMHSGCYRDAVMIRKCITCGTCAAFCVEHGGEEHALEKMVVHMTTHKQGAT